MLQRHTEVKFRDNQENRVQQFPKTPKNVNTQSSKFVTPAPKPRVALGAKSTNVHHRQFTSAKTGKRHSPVTASKRPVEFVKPVRTTELKGAASLRAALEKSLFTGIDVPDVERCPEPMDELPYEEPESMEPMPWDAINALIERSKLKPSVQSRPPIDKELVFIPMKQSLSNASNKSTVLQPKGPPVASDKRVERTKEVRHNSSRLGGFAAPTAAAKAKVKGPHESLSRSKSSTNSSMPSVRSTHRAASQTSSTTLARDLQSLELHESENDFLFKLPEVELADLPEIDTSEDMKVDWDFED